jgi:hypothetical protein
LYTVVMGVALSLAVRSMIDEKGGLETVTWPIALLFFAFVATLFPFFHGALRHLDDAYVDNKNSGIREGALAVDFVLLFIHALAFVILALLLKKPGQFAWVLVILLSIDVVWGVFVIFGPSGKKGFNAETKWTLINLVFVLVSLVFLVWFGVTPLRDGMEPLRLALPIFASCVIRTVIDYVWCADFYFPK